jgi:Co/Zn/Cd efflux system component
MELGNWYLKAVHTHTHHHHHHHHQQQQPQNNNDDGDNSDADETNKRKTIAAISLPTVFLCPFGTTKREVNAHDSLTV